MKGRTQGAGGRGGFTLIELMVVLVMIGIISAVIIPEMTGTYDDAVLRSTSRELINVFGLAYSRAISQQQTFRVRFDPAGGRYALEKRNRQSLRPNDFTPVNDLPGSVGKIDKRVAIELREVENEFTVASEQPPPNVNARREMTTLEDLDSVAFNADGTADAREIVLRDRTGFRLGLRVNPTTARIQVLEMERQ